jgi:putative adenylate-forming enzyme
MGLLHYMADYIWLNRRLYHDSPRRIAGRQARAVRRLVGRVRRESPFYRNLYAGRTIASLNDFASLPTIDKTILMANFDGINTAGLRLAEAMDFVVQKELRCDYLGYFKDRYVLGLSSGTSGNKGLFVTDRKLTARLPGVFLARGGVSLADLPLRILFILRVFSQGFADINAPLIHLRYLPSMTQPREIVDFYNRMNANILMAPPSLLRQLLPLSDAIRRPPRRIITYAEVLEPEEKARLAAAFHAAVVEIYQASEGQIASPCRCGSLHINEDLVYVELLDEKGQALPDEPGRRAARMLVTNLVNTVQPLLRYEMNDILELGGPCPCGSHFRVISRIIGRQDDVLFLRLPEGGLRAVYPDLVSRWIITTDDQIREFLVEQMVPERIRITLDLTAPDDARQDILNRLRRRFQQELAEFGIACELDLVVRPIRLPADNRKLKRFIRHFAAG